MTDNTDESLWTNPEPPTHRAGDFRWEILNFAGDFGHERVLHAALLAMSAQQCENLWAELQAQARRELWQPTAPPESLDHLLLPDA